MSSPEPNSTESSLSATATPSKSGQWRTVRLDELTRKPFKKVVADSLRVAAAPTSAEIPRKEATLDSSPASLAANLSTDPAADSSLQGKPSDPSTLDPRFADPNERLKRRQSLEHHIKSNPTDLGSFMELARIYRAEMKPIEAKRVLDQARQIFPDDQALLWEFEEATLARSLQQLREVNDLATRLDTAETDRELQRCQHDWARRRIEICRARLQRDRSQIHLVIALGEAMHDAGMYEGAFEELEPAIARDDFCSAAHLLRGKCLLAMKKELEAMAELRTCALRRSVVAPIRTRILALRLLCETADRLGIRLTSARYHEQLRLAEQDLARQPAAVS